MSNHSFVMPNARLRLTHAVRWPSQPRKIAGFAFQLSDDLYAMVVLYRDTPGMVQLVPDAPNAHWLDGCAALSLDSDVNHPDRVLLEAATELLAQRIWDVLCVARSAFSDLMHRLFAMPIVSQIEEEEL